MRRRPRFDPEHPDPPDAAPSPLLLATVRAFADSSDPGHCPTKGAHCSCWWISNKECCDCEAAPRHPELVGRMTPASTRNLRCSGLTRSDKQRVRERLAWTGPREGDLDKSGDRLIQPVPPARWPYGPPTAHEECCFLHEGGIYCDCEASDAEDEGDGS